MHVGRQARRQAGRQAKGGRWVGNDRKQHRVLSNLVWSIRFNSCKTRLLFSCRRRLDNHVWSTDIGRIRLTRANTLFFLAVDVYLDHHVWSTVVGGIRFELARNALFSCQRH